MDNICRLFENTLLEMKIFSLTPKNIRDFVDKIRAKISSENEFLKNICDQYFNKVFDEFYSPIEESIESLEKSLNDKWIEYPNEEELFVNFLNDEIYFSFLNKLSQHFNKYNIKFDDKIYLKTFESIDEKCNPNNDNKEEENEKNIAEEVEKNKMV